MNTKRNDSKVRSLIQSFKFFVLAAIAFGLVQWLPSHAKAQEIQDTPSMNEFFAGKEITVRGQASDNAFCSALESFCPTNVRQRAEQKASRDTESACFLQKGTALNYTKYCFSSCSPGYIPPNQSMWVNCRAECNMKCQIPESSPQ